MAEIRYGQMVQLEKDLEKHNKELRHLQKNGSMLKEEVDDEDIAEIVAKWTKIPLSKLMEGETEKLIHMEESLKHAWSARKKSFKWCRLAFAVRAQV